MPDNLDGANCAAEYRSNGVFHTIASVGLEIINEDDLHFFLLTYSS